MFDFLKKKPKGAVAEIKIDGMHCTSCSMNVDATLEELPGVFSATTSYAKQQTVVDYDPAKISEQKIEQAITELGYSVVKKN